MFKTYIHTCYITGTGTTGTGTTGTGAGTGAGTGPGPGIGTVPAGMVPVPVPAPVPAGIAPSVLTRSFSSRVWRGRRRGRDGGSVAGWLAERWGGRRIVQMSRWSPRGYTSTAGASMSTAVQAEKESPTRRWVDTSLRASWYPHPHPGHGSAAQIAQRPPDHCFVARGQGLAKPGRGFARGPPVRSCGGISHVVTIVCICYVR